MQEILLPLRFKEKLSSSNELSGIVDTTLSVFEEIYRDNKLYFFNEYTDHGINHIQDILNATDNLIPDTTFNNILSDKDIAHYVLSVILHDIGMHINLEGFLYLLEGNNDSIRIKEFDKLTWKELWEDFFSEAKKYSGKQLKMIFGNEYLNIESPNFLVPGKITEDDKKLIGEFIRKHHTRLAHEIAINGFPGKSQSLEFAKNLDLKNRNIIGLIARSHGIGLRKCLEYIETGYGKNVKRIPLGIHAIYLMILLRIADYIQIDGKRTSKILLKIKTFSSPISELEHQTHLNIDAIDFKYQDDPERIYVSASPKDSKMYLKLKKLVTDIQYEFDISWAVLGELYGAFDDKPEIKYRRITSNLDEDIFIANQNYIAEKFSFTANDEIIKLLIAPLYGNDPTYGVRELLQNAVDACKEREFIEKKSGNILYKSSVKIQIAEEGSESFCIISDNGIGMDIEVIKNYFLTAGASYRKSIEWQKEFIDNDGNVQIRRSGRFGVGILSAFLIGKEILVETRNINKNIGYRFKADLNTEQIDVIKSLDISIGTEIKIKINKEVLEKFKTIKKDNSNANETLWFKWFTLSNPKVEYHLLGNEIVSYNNQDPDNIELLPTEWNSIDIPGFNKILWTYNKKGSNVSFACNGIIIPQTRYHPNLLSLGLISNKPNISIFDNNAVTPLSLDRNYFTDKLPFEKELQEDIYKDFIAYLLVSTKINSIDKYNNIKILNWRLGYPGCQNYTTFSYGLNDYSEARSRLKSILDIVLISKTGFILNYNYFINKLTKINAILIQLDLLFSETNLNIDIQDKFLLIAEGSINSINDYRNAIEPDSAYFNNDTKMWDSGNRDIIFYLKTEKYNYLFAPNAKRVPGWVKYEAKFVYDNNLFTCFHFGTPKSSLISNDFLQQNPTINFIREYEIECKYEGDKILNKLLQKYIGNDVVIPYSVEDRKKKFPLAFIELERYMQKYIKE